MTTRQKKTKKPRAPLPTKIPQPHGGALLSGGMPGHDGSNAGRRPSWVRDACLQAFAARVPRLGRIADGVVPMTEACPECGHEADATAAIPPEVSDMLRAADMLGKYGLGEKGEFATDVVQGNLDRTLSVAESVMDEEAFTAFCRQVDAIWNEGRRG